VEPRVDVIDAQDPAERAPPRYAMPLGAWSPLATICTRSTRWSPFASTSA
jgi:hypothetical protein